MNYLADKAMSTAISLFPGGHNLLYQALKTTVPGFQFFSVFYNSVLDDDSRKQLDLFRKKNVALNQLHGKIGILIDLMKSETMTAKVFLSDQENMETAKKYLSMIGIENVSVNAIPQLEIDVKQNIYKIESLVQTQNPFGVIFDKMSSILKLKGGKRTKRTKKRKTRRRGGVGDEDSIISSIGKALSPAAFEGINRASFNYWHMKDPIKYASYDGSYYYPSAVNKYNPLYFGSVKRTNEPQKWTDRVKRHCGGETNLMLFENCVKKKCSPMDDSSFPGSSCNVKTYK